MSFYFQKIMVYNILTGKKLVTADYLRTSCNIFSILLRKIDYQGISIYEISLIINVLVCAMLQNIGIEMIF